MVANKALVLNKALVANKALVVNKVMVEALAVKEVVAAHHMGIIEVLLYIVMSVKEMYYLQNL